MSASFRELLKKVGSGPHTGKNLTRAEAATATELILKQEATPAQIGAFLIAHRIKRPTSEELAGMLDAYDQFGGKIPPLTEETAYPVTVFGVPYDARSRTAPVFPITLLLLASLGVPVILQGGDCMPTKYGLPYVDIWEGLGINYRSLTLEDNHKLLSETGIAFYYLPKHFPQAQKLVPYRDEIGKRPPFATLELIWSPYAGEANLISGFVHPPTEDRFREVFDLRPMKKLITVKGLEGSCDLARNRTGIIGVREQDQEFQRLNLHPEHYGFAGRDVLLESKEQLIQDLQSVIEGKPGELMSAAIWNGGAYLYLMGICADLSQGLAQAEELIKNGKIADKLRELQIQVTTNLGSGSKN
ncbi:anthranilate phosphoribosyltransferase family protein [Euhalothece natronophila Z-M001]|uniref:Anthranilate phosphoribosyltransferase family protein n=1 Tax=Euhalothece natronophila Z-M001 TaxID=522448 RepID=A0A5B8NLY0_9CHRO|nr:anthranilate phosphoribosyltransferase family protein [Euhalothece natronophila]QDZ39089.1 anthranilate phosphoribosyltransferase family protein [Euhalothece natronophila Z-M001]